MWELDAYQLTSAAVAHKTMNIILKSIIITLLFFAISMFFAFFVVLAYQEPPPKPHNSLLTDYSKLDIQTQVTQDVGIIEEI